MENSLLKQSYINMIESFKKSKGLIFKVFLLVLIPVMIINCYSFYTVYGGVGLNYSAIETLDYEGMFSGSPEAITQFQDAMFKLFPYITYEQSFGDIVLEFVNTLMIILLDAFVILLVTGIVFEFKKSGTEILKASIRKIPMILFFSILASWIVLEIQQIIYSGVFMFVAFLPTQQYMLIYSSIVSALMLAVGGTFLASWILLYIRYMAIASVSGRCRFMLAFGYAREVLKGRVWRNIFRIMPFIIGGFIIPLFIQAFAIAYGDNIALSLVLVAVSIIIEMLVFLLMWVYTVPEFFFQERESGIQQKIKEMIEQAMNMRKNQQTEDNNNDDKKE